MEFYYIQNTQQQDSPQLNHVRSQDHDGSNTRCSQEICVPDETPQQMDMIINGNRNEVLYVKLLTTNGKLTVPAQHIRHRK